MEKFAWFEKQWAIVDIFDGVESGIEDGFGIGLGLLQQGREGTSWKLCVWMHVSQDGSWMGQVALEKE